MSDDNKVKTLWFTNDPVLLQKSPWENPDRWGEYEQFTAKEELIEDYLHLVTTAEIQYSETIFNTIDQMKNLRIKINHCNYDDCGLTQNTGPDLVALSKKNICLFEFKRKLNNGNIKKTFGHFDTVFKEGHYTNYKKNDDLPVYFYLCIFGIDNVKEKPPLEIPYTASKFLKYVKYSNNKTDSFEKCYNLKREQRPIIISLFEIFKKDNDFRKKIIFEKRYMHKGTAISCKQYLSASGVKHVILEMQKKISTPETVVSEGSLPKRIKKLRGDLQVGLSKEYPDKNIYVSNPKSTNTNSYYFFISKTSKFQETLICNVVVWGGNKYNYCIEGDFLIKTFPFGLTKNENTHLTYYYGKDYVNKLKNICFIKSFFDKPHTKDSFLQKKNITWEEIERYKKQIIQLFEFHAKINKRSPGQAGG